MTAANVLETIIEYDSVALIGMDKNSGKTTVLNHIICEARGKLALGLTSIGRDGEAIDEVTGTEKPRIYVERGTNIATSRKYLLCSDISREILDTTGIQTPMGEIIIARALSDGFIQLAGPSITTDINNVCRALLGHGSKLIIVDGAISRKSSASPFVTDAAILCTGASLGKSIYNVVKETKHTANLLSIAPETQLDVLQISKSILCKARLGFIFKDFVYKTVQVLTALDASKIIIENLHENTTYIVISGAITDKLLSDIMKSGKNLKNITLLVEDGTKLFLSHEYFNGFICRGGLIKAINPINLVCITCNPNSPYGYNFNGPAFLELLKEAIPLPVFDVLGGEKY